MNPPQDTHLYECQQAAPQLHALPLHCCPHQANQDFNMHQIPQLT